MGKKRKPLPCFRCGHGVRLGLKLPTVTHAERLCLACYRSARRKSFAGRQLTLFAG